MYIDIFYTCFRFWRVGAGGVKLRSNRGAPDPGRTKGFQGGCIICKVMHNRSMVLHRTDTFGDTQ